MAALDEKIRPMYEGGTGCRSIAAELGEFQATVFKRVRRMGIMRSADEIIRKSVRVVPIPFTHQPSNIHLRKAAIGYATAWFLSRGYMVSLPMEPAFYDLIVESDLGLKRVQIKTTTHRSHGRWVASVHRQAYDTSAVTKRKRVSYTSGDIDIFFFITGSGDKYLIPLSVVEEHSNRIVLDIKYERYKVG